MLTLTSTQFTNNFGQRNQEVQAEPIEVQSHGRTVGFYISPAQYRRMEDAMRRASQPGAYNSIKGLVLEKRAEIRAIAKKYNINDIYLVGSVARGEDRPQSDIDFLVEYPAGYTPTFEDFGIDAELSRLLGDREINIVNHAKVDKRIKQSMAEDAVEI